MLAKKISNFIAITVLLAVILSACAPATTAATESPATSAPESTSAATEAPAATDAPTESAKPSGTVTLWMWKAAHDTLTNSGVLDEFAKEYPDVQVEVVEYAPTDVYQKLPLASRLAQVPLIYPLWRTVILPKSLPWAALPI